jgi:CelD/BcsL family acetyltransferase involved in cellulose biosynthesis
MKLYVLPVSQLTADHVAAWSSLQQRDARLANPFFRPEFAQEVAAERADVEVAIWEQSGEPVGFLPFERAIRRLGKPVGSHMNEFQGAITRSDVAWSPPEVVRAAGLRTWRFDHLAFNQTALGPFQYLVVPSPYLDLSNGFEHYCKSRVNSSGQVSEALRKVGKATREFGSVRLENEPMNRRALRQLLDWKADQCRRTQLPCLYDQRWVVRIFERLLDHSSSRFSGMLLCLYIGERLAAARFALRSAGILHSAVFGFDRGLARLSPGLMLNVQTAQAANAWGITRIDIGKGVEPYKDGLASGYDQVCEGAVHAHPLQAPLGRRWFQVKQRLRATPLRSAVWRVRRWTHSTRTWLGYTN